jgi:hypothetical protein
VYWAPSDSAGASAPGSDVAAIISGSDNNRGYSVFTAPAAGGTERRALRSLYALLHVQASREETGGRVSAVETSETVALSRGVRYCLPADTQVRADTTAEQA